MMSTSQIRKENMDDVARLIVAKAYTVERWLPWLRKWASEKIQQRWREHNYQKKLQTWSSEAEKALKELKIYRRQVNELLVLRAVDTISFP